MVHGFIRDVPAFVNEVSFFTRFLSGECILDLLDPFKASVSGWLQQSVDDGIKLFHDNPGF